MKKELIRVEKLSFRYGSKLILENINFSLGKGEILILMGLNGSGKSTLINCIMGFLKPQSGKVYYNGINTLSMSRNDRAHIVSYVPQDIGTSCSLNVLEYLSLGRIAYKKMYQIASKEDYDCVREHAKKMDIEHLLNKNMNEISGGERQLVAITKSLIQETPVIIFDEPTAALDYKNQILYLQTIKKLCKEGKTVILSTHNPNHALSLNSIVALIHNRLIFAYGEARKTLTNEVLQSVYNKNVKIIQEKSRSYCVFDIKE